MQIKKINIVAQTKGGVGKTTFSTQVLPIVLGDNFKITEIDNANKTEFKNSNMQIETINTSRSDNKFDDLFFEEMTSDIINIIDAGGGTDTIAILNQLQSQDTSQIQYFIPLRAGEDAYNLKQTIQMLPQNADIIVVCMGYTDIENIKEHFMYIYGSAEYEIKSIKEEYPDIKILNIPFSNLFSIAKTSYYTTVKELSEQVRNIEPADARKQILKDSNQDQVLYRKMYVQYKMARECLKLEDQIKSDFEKIN